MPTLRERLEGLSALRVSAEEPRKRRRGDASLATASRFDLHTHDVPLSARRWLDSLPGADAQVAALLARGTSAPVPATSEWLFLDLETTGLAGGTGTYAFLIGLGRLTTAGFTVEQFFLRELADEAALLEALAPQLSTAQAVVTYNGKLFDVPVLETRYRLARLRWPYETSPAAGAAGLKGEKPVTHLDLLYPARQMWKVRWGSARLLDLESGLLGYERTEDVPGSLIPQLYFDYLRSGDERPLASVFRHNVEDVVTLAALTARLLELAAQPEAAADSLEQFALGRLFERAREFDRARMLYEQALGDSPPEEIASAVRYRLALLCKRQRDYRRALALWQELAQADSAGADGTTLAVYEELAICYEHRLDDPEAAAEVTQRALAQLDYQFNDEAPERARFRRVRRRFAHRLSRLRRRQPGGLVART